MPARLAQEPRLQKELLTPIFLPALHPGQPFWYHSANEHLVDQLKLDTNIKTKSNRTLSTPELEESIQKALEVYSTKINKHFAMSHREIGARQLIISCIYTLNKEQLNKVDDAVMSIARDLNQQTVGIKR